MLMETPEKGELLAFVKPTKRIGDMTDDEGFEFAKSLVLLMRARGERTGGTKGRRNERAFPSAGHLTRLAALTRPGRGCLGRWWRPVRRWLTILGSPADQPATYPKL
jgi:hypothetical protein